LQSIGDVVGGGAEELLGWYFHPL